MTEQWHTDRWFTSPWNQDEQVAGSYRFEELKGLLGDADVRAIAEDVLS